MKIAIQGISGSFHHEAAIKLLKQKDLNIIACSSFKNVFKSLESNEVDSAVVAIENTNYGSINEVYDLLEKYNNKIKIIDEIPLKVHQNLIAKHSIELSKIRQVMSHPIAIDQCSDFLNKYLSKAKIILSEDTALSIKDLGDYSDQTVAVGSAMAAEMYGRKIIEKNIDNRANYTRFLLLSRGLKKSENQSNKYSVVINLAHTEGSLSNLLNLMSKKGYNLTKIQSRPYINKPWQYKIYIDFIIPSSSLGVIKLLEEARVDYRILGNYPAKIF